MCVHFVYTVLKIVTVAFTWCFLWFNWFSYCRGNCAGQANTIVSHFVVQRADLIVVISCFPCGPCCSLIYACEWWFCGALKIVCCCTIKPDCRLRLLWSRFLIESAACVLSFYHSTPLHIYYYSCMTINFILKIHLCTLTHMKNL